MLDGIKRRVFRIIFMLPFIVIMLRRMIWRRRW